MDILPIISKYGLKKRNENPVIKTLDTEISNLNRIGKRVNKNVIVLDPFVYLKKVKGVELNKDDNLNVSPKNLEIPIPPIPFIMCWEFSPSVSTISNFSIGTTNNEGIDVDWSNSEIVTFNENFTTNKNLTLDNSSISIRNKTRGDDIESINLGFSSPKLKGTINLSEFKELKYFISNQNDIDYINGYDQLEKLVSIQFNNNKVKGSIHSLQKNTNLETFRAEFNNTIKGEIPNLDNNIALKNFYLGNNSLSGNIPSLNLNVNLQNFRVNNNPLIWGSIPKLNNNLLLRSFWCNVCQLTGNIPDLSNNLEMTIFLCSNNKLSGWDGGTIPPKLLNFQVNGNNLTVQTVDSLLYAYELMANTTGLSGLLNIGNVSPSVSGYIRTNFSGNAFSRVGNLVTANVTNHNFTSGDIVTFTSINPSQLGGTFIVNVNNPNQFTYNTLDSGNITGSGSATMRKVTGPCGYKSYQNLALKSRLGGPWDISITEPT